MPHDATRTLIDLEKRFWQTRVDDDTGAALALLHEPALVVDDLGVVQFDHARYREMAARARMVVTSYSLSDMHVMFPNEDTAVLTYRVRQAMAQRGGPAAEAVEQWTADASVWTRKDGVWRCVMHTETEVEDEGDQAAEGANT